MRIQPVAFNYLEMSKDFPDLVVEIKRKNVVLQNEKYVMWGEKIDEEKGIMMLMSVSLSRKYTKDTKQTIFDDWKNTLHKYASELPEEIKRKWEDQEKKRLAEEAALAEKEKAKAEKAAKKEEKVTSA